jgi:DNA-binding transcriptional regulator LsrR (DeoR family)
MGVRQFRHTKEEISRRGREIYESKVRSEVEEGNQGKIVAIDIETGVFKIAKDSLTASDQLLEQDPDAQIWLGRVGHRAVHRVGSVGLK